MRAAVCARRLAQPAALQLRMHSGDMSVNGTTRTTNLGFFSVNRREYPAWYQSLMALLHGSSFDRFYTRVMNYRRYGLKFEDILLETDDVTQALKRLPKDVLSARDDRIKRALVLQTGGDQLPTNKWTTEQEDAPYLAPYLAQVVQERRDLEAFRPR